MDQKRALIVSLLSHAAVFGLLLSGIDLSVARRPRAALPIEARLVMKKQKAKELLPRKNPASLEAAQEPPAEKKPAKPVVTENAKKPEAVKPSAEAIKTAKAATPAPKKGLDYTKALASLSSAFAQELAEHQPEEPAGEAIDDASYFDQIYSLIKNSFVVPPHINGPLGENLLAIIQIHLAADGSLLMVNLVSSSGDEHFDKAVTEGARRVTSFGPVPDYLQNHVRERGVVIEMCPFTCKER